jgi:tRNA 2-thiouridine synthesizing protein A
MSDDAQPSPTAVVDARGLQCPMPLVRASRAAKELAPGEWIEVLATDRGSVPDFKAWIDGCAEYELLSQNEQPGDDGRTVYVHHLKRL